MRIFSTIVLLAGLFLGAFYVNQELSAYTSRLANVSDEIKNHRQKNDEVLLTLKEEKAALERIQASTKVYRMIAGGDIMLDRGVKARVKSLSKDYNFPFDLLRETFKNADLVFANLEGSMSDVGEDTGKKYSFRFEPEAAFGLEDSGIDVLSLANNHMLDWGRESLCKTTEYLKQIDITYAGAGCDSREAEAPAIVELGNTRIAILAYTEFYKGAHATETRSGMSEYDLEKISTRIQELKENQGIDLVMVSMHWGDEYKPRANDYQVATAHTLVDAGADLILGHHPHVPQQIERYRDAWIIYSLGNLVFDQSWSKETMESILADISIQDKKIIDVKAIPIQINNNFQPHIVQ